MAAEKELLQAVEQMKAGKEEGFNTLYSYTYNYVYGRARYYMNNNEEDALDLTQETFVQAYKGIANLQDSNNIYAWLGSITYRQSMKMHNKRKDVLVNEDAEGIFEDIECTSKDFQPEETAEENAVVDVIKGMLEELPEKQKEVILAFYYDHMKIDEIAELFDCSPNTIKSRLNYAKQYLKEMVLAHEKKYAYRLHSVTPAAIYLAFKSLFAEKDYVLAAEKAQGIYDAACSVLSIAPTTIAAGGVASGATATSATASGTGASTAAGSSAGGVLTGAADVVVKTGLGIGAKITIGVAAVLTTGALAVGGMAATGNLPSGVGGAWLEGIVSGQDSNGTDSSDDTTSNVPKGKLEKIMGYDSAGNPDGYTLYEYDENGNNVKVVRYSDGQRGSYTVYEYDSNGNNTGVISYSASDVVESNFQYEYDANGNQIKYTRYDKSGNVLWYGIKEYDEQNRQVKCINYHTDTETHIRVYDESGKSVETRYNGAGEIIMTLEYDEKGNLTKQVVEPNEGYPAQSINIYVYEYNENGKVTKETHYIENNQQVKSTVSEYNENGEISKRMTYDRDNNLEHTSVYIYAGSTAEIESEKESQEDTTLKECQDLSDSKWIEVEAYDKDVHGFEYQGFAIPAICQWDEAAQAFVASDNGSNANGESIIVNAKAIDLDKNNADYSVGLAKVQKDLDVRKDSYKSYDIQYSNDDKIYSYYYVTESAETINGKEMVRTKGYFELTMYNRPYSASTYISLIFEVDIVKPKELTKNSVDKYVKDLYESITDGWIYSIK